VDAAALPAIILAIAEQRSVNAVLAKITETVAAQPDVALACVWLLQSDRDCPDCLGSGAGSMAGALQLGGCAGHKSGVDSHRIAMDNYERVSRIALSGRPERIQQLSEDWARDAGIVGFAGRPLVFGGEVLGVLAAFRSKDPDDVCWDWLGSLADSGAVAIANARALEENESLRRELELERDYLREEVRAAGAFGEILGSSPALKLLLSQVEMVATTEANVLVLGESGTGKELVARAIHQHSERAGKPLVKVNCGSIPRELFESEFFGHVRGSFTGAVRDRVGRFQLAHGGTLFLDEIGEIPLDLQAKLLRVLQEGEFERVGDDTTQRVNVRIIAASNRDLKREVDEGRFRLDLYYRLGVFPLEVPPLRDRREDIPDLIAHFVRQACMRFHLPEARVTRPQLDRAQHYDWPGNVRELQNVIERAVIVSRGGSLALDLPEIRRSPGDLAESPSGYDEIIPEREWRNRERANILAALKRSDFRISGKGGAAELLGLNPATLASRVKALGIEKRHYRLDGPRRQRQGA
jgi:transcriptional regulator with GAF, ATPase, and Fis domain